MTKLAEDTGYVLFRHTEKIHNTIMLRAEVLYMPSRQQKPDARHTAYYVALLKSTTSQNPPKIFF
jgi:hypothetical protein